MTLDLFAHADALFGGPAPRLRAAPASAPFLDLLAERLIESLAARHDPFALSDALMLLPNRRATRGLIDAFAQRLGGAALLPTIRPIGDPQLDDDPDVWGAEPIAFDVAPAIDPHASAHGTRRADPRARCGGRRRRRSLARDRVGR